MTMTKRPYSLTKFAKKESWDPKVSKLDYSDIGYPMDVSPEVNRLIELQGMKMGGSVSPLYHMAGGGPLFINSKTPELLEDDYGRKQAAAEKGSSAAKSSSPKDVATNWVTGDYNETEAKLAQAQKSYADAVIRYGGDTKAAMNDPYVKAAMSSAEPNPYTVDKLNRRREMFDRYKESIFQTGNLKGDNLDIDEIEKYHGKTGQVQPITVGQSFRMYEDTPLTKLNENSVGSTWDKAGKVVYGQKDMQDELDRIFAPAEESFMDVKSDIPKGLEQIVSPLGDKVYEHFKTETTRSRSNEGAIRAAATAITSQLKNTSPGFEKYLKEQYLRTHVNDEGNLQYYYDEKGNETDDFKKFKDLYVEREIRNRISKTREKGVSYSGGRYEDWDAGAGTVKGKIGPWEDVIKDKNIGATNMPMNIGTPNPDGTVTYKGGVTKVYPMTDEHRQDLNPYLGKRVLDFNSTGGVMGAGGALMKLPSDLQLGAITNIDGTLYKMPKIAYDGKGRPIHQDPKNSEMGTYIKAMVAFSADDMNKHPELGDYIPVGGTTKMEFMPYSYDKAQEKFPDVKSTSWIGSDMAANHQMFGAQDVTNREFFDMAIPSGEKGPDGKPLTFGSLYESGAYGVPTGLSKDVYLVPMYIPVSDGWALEEKRKGSEAFPGGPSSATQRTASQYIRTVKQ